MDNERFYPVEPGLAYAALHDVVARMHKLKSADDFSRAVWFVTRASGFSWGANFNAHVRPVEGGSLVVINGEQKVRTNFTAKGAEFRRIVDTLDSIGTALARYQAER